MRVLAALICTSLLAACSGADGTAVNLNTGDLAPNFQTASLDGMSAQFPGAWAGRPLTVNFWANWCEYCEGEMKAIEAVYQRHKREGLDVVAVNVGEDHATVQAFIKKIGVTYPILLDENSALAKRYGVVALPTTFFVDAKGVVRGKLVGSFDEATFDKQASEFLATGAVASKPALRAEEPHLHAARATTGSHSSMAVQEHTQTPATAVEKNLQIMRDLMGRIRGASDGGKTASSANSNDRNDFAACGRSGRGMRVPPVFLYRFP